MRKTNILPLYLTASMLLSACTAETPVESAPLPVKTVTKAPVYTPTQTIAAIPPIPTVPNADEAQASVITPDGMHPVCTAYFKYATACFNKAPEPQRNRLLVSLNNSLAELQTADETTCLLIQRQFDDWKSQTDC